MSRRHRSRNRKFGSQRNLVSEEAKGFSSDIPYHNAILPVRSNDPSYLLFLRDAASAVANHLDFAIELIRSEKLGIGKWHPTGFATFDILAIDDLGLMRLHFWPIRLRRALPGHPQIHRHCFQLYSRVLAGEYRESQYEAREVIQEKVDKPEAGYSRLREFLVEPSVGDGVDRLHDSGKSRDVKAIFRGLRFPAGTWHEIEVGQFHSTPIPKQQLCVTLAVLSLPVKGADDVLLGNATFKTLKNRRLIVSEDETRVLCRQYKDAL